MQKMKDFEGNLCLWLVATFGDVGKLERVSSCLSVRPNSSTPNYYTSRYYSQLAFREKAGVVAWA